MADRLAELASAYGARRANAPEGIDEEDPLVRRLLSQGLSVDQVRALFLWIAQRGYGRQPGPDFSPVPSPGEPDVPREWPIEEALYPPVIFPPGYEERGRLLRIPPPDEYAKPFIRRM